MAKVDGTPRPFSHTEDRVLQVTGELQHIWCCTPDLRVLSFVSSPQLAVAFAGRKQDSQGSKGDSLYNSARFRHQDGTSTCSIGASARGDLLESHEPHRPTGVQWSAKRGPYWIFWEGSMAHPSC